jgi:hypothetical protein
MSCCAAAYRVYLGARSVNDNRLPSGSVSRAIRQAEVGAARTMIERTEERFGLKPERLAADAAYGSAANRDGLVNDKQIAPHIPMIDKSKRDDGTFSREDFTFDKVRDLYICLAGELLRTTGSVSTDHAMRYIAPVPVCRTCPLKAKCCPNMPARRIARDVNEDARDVARALAKTEAFEQSCRDRKRVEMLFAHLKRILRLGRLRPRGPRGAQDEFTLAAIAQTCAGWPSSSPDRRYRPWHALRKPRSRRCQCVAAPTGARGRKRRPPALAPISPPTSAQKSARSRHRYSHNTLRRRSMSSRRALDAPDHVTWPRSRATVRSERASARSRWCSTMTMATS